MSYQIVKTSYESACIVPHSPYTDWCSHLYNISNLNEKSIIELGLGLGTKVLLEHFKEVFSFEVVNTDEWYKKSVEDYKSYTNWKHQFFFMKEFGLDVTDTELLNSGGLSRNVEPLKKYFHALEVFLPTIAKMDVALVDQGFHFRGETVSYFLEKQIPIVIAHDTYNHDQIYGYDKIVMPDNYTKETYGRLGTTIYTRQ